VPAHPLLVHLPVVLLPLAALGVVVMVLRPAWHRRYRWAVLAVGVVATVGAVLAASAGEDLEERIEAREGRAAAVRWERHAELGGSARLAAVVFVVLLAAFVLVPWFLERREDRGRPVSVPSWFTSVFAGLALLAAAASVYTVAQAGHTGGRAAWCGYHSPPNCDTEGDAGDD
jgi:hypothetical protein